MALREFSLKELAEKIGAQLKGDEGAIVSGIATLQSADRSHISFLANPVYEKYLEDSQAGAIILSEKFADKCQANVLVHENPYLAYAKLSHFWDTLPAVICDDTSVHETAIVHESAVIEKGVFIDAGVVVKAGVVIKMGAVIGSNCVIGEDSVVGEKTRLHACVTIYHGVHVGARCIIHSGVILGSDGFGFAPVGCGWEKIAQIGGVILEDDIEVGANTTIDRGALDNTVIESGVKLDNQIQIAHNVRIGQNTAMAACCAVAGSTTIGKNCIIGGASGIAGHLTVVDNVHITAMTMVIKSLNEPGVYSSGTGVQPNAKWRRSIARLRQLDKMAGRIKALEKIVKS